VIVKIEDGPVHLNEQAQRKKFRNEDLPHGCQDENRWCGKFIPTLLWFVAYSQTDPWNLDEHGVIKAMQLIWDKLYGNAIPYQITVQDAVYIIVSCTISEITYTNITSPRPYSAPVTRGETLWHPPHRRVLRPSSSPAKSSAPMRAARRFQLTTYMT
jgi:hypothetical protein